MLDDFKFLVCGKLFTHNPNCPPPPFFFSTWNHLKLLVFEFLRYEFVKVIVKDSVQLVNGGHI